jgi:hypothetical protein
LLIAMSSILVPVQGGVCGDFAPQTPHPAKVCGTAKPRRTPYPLTEWNSSLLIAMSSMLLYSLNGYGYSYNP